MSLSGNTKRHPVHFISANPFASSLKLDWLQREDGGEALGRKRNFRFGGEDYFALARGERCRRGYRPLPKFKLRHGRISRRMDVVTITLRETEAQLLHWPFAAESSRASRRRGGRV